jgi:hypothetical protein
MPPHFENLLKPGDLSNHRGNAESRLLTPARSPTGRQRNIYLLCCGIALDGEDSGDHVRALFLYLDTTNVHTGATPMNNLQSYRKLPEV